VSGADDDEEWRGAIKFATQGGPFDAGNSWARHRELSALLFTAQAERVPREEVFFDLARIFLSEVCPPTRTPASRAPHRSH
jgi:hypothetical protein